MRSLKARLGSGLLIVLLIVFTVQWLLVSLAINQLTENYITSRMAEDIDNILASLTFNQSDNAELIRGPDDRYNRGPFTGYYFQVNADKNIIRSRSIWDQTLSINSINVGETVIEKMSGPLDQPLLVLSKGFRKQGHAITISVAEDISSIQMGMRNFQRWYLLLSFGFLFLLLVSQQWIVHRSLQSLSVIRFNLEQVTQGEKQKLSEEVPAEILPLVTEINLLLDLLARRLEKTRTAVGNLAHALKTPLSLLRNITHAPSLKDDSETRQQLNKQIETMQTSLEHELNRARLAGDGKSGRHFKPNEDLPLLMETLEQIHQSRAITISLNKSNNNNWPADREDIMELFGNLADNACKWANKEVLITLTSNTGCFFIEDDGPGCPADKLELLSQRGSRLDESVSGHGLGLSIVSDIVNYYQGRIEFESSGKLGGLKVSVTLFSD